MLLGREEGLEHVFQLPLRNTGALVRDGHHHRVAVCPSGGDRRLTFLTGPLAHRVTGVEEQVHQDLLELHAVGRDSRQDRREPGVHQHLALDQLAVHQPEDLPHDLVDVERLELQFPALQQRMQPADHLAGAPVVGDDVFEDVAHFR